MRCFILGLVTSLCAASPASAVPIIPTHEITGAITHASVSAVEALAQNTAIPAKIPAGFPSVGDAWYLGFDDSLRAIFRVNGYSTQTQYGEDFLDTVYGEHIGNSLEFDCDEHCVSFPFGYLTQNLTINLQLAPGGKILSGAMRYIASDFCGYGADNICKIEDLGKPGDKQGLMYLAFDGTYPSPASVPEPLPAGLMALGLTGIAWMRHRRKRLGLFRRTVRGLA